MLIGLKRFSRTRGAAKGAGHAKLDRFGSGMVVVSVLAAAVAFVMTPGAKVLAEDDIPSGLSHAVGDGPPKERYYTPFYDESSGSYFQLVSPQRTFGWVLARDDAERRSYAGRKGRLAVIKSNATSNNIMKNLYADAHDDTWIGLEYICDARALAWTDGTLFKPGDFANWGAQWSRSDFAEDCTNESMGVTISPGFSYHWLAWGKGKGFDWYLVEYPAPENKKTSDASKPAANQ